MSLVRQSVCLPLSISREAADGGLVPSPVLSWLRADEAEVEGSYKKESSFSCKKGLDKGGKRVYSIQADGRLAQLVAHPLDVREVTSSSLVSSTIDSSLKSDESFLFPCFLLSKVHDSKTVPLQSLARVKNRGHSERVLMVFSILAAEFFFMVSLA